MTSQELLPGATTMNLYEYDVNAPKGEKVTQVSTGSPDAEVLGVARVSEDGSHVYFVAKGVLTGANHEGHAPAAGGDNLYVYERDEAFPDGRLAFIATLGRQKQNYMRDGVRRRGRPRRMRRSRPQRIRRKK